MKKTNILFAAIGLMAFASCKKDAQSESDYFEKTLNLGNEISVIQESDYPSELTQECTGDIFLAVRSNPAEVTYYSQVPLYSFSGSVETPSSVSVDLTAGTSNEHFVFATGDFSSYKTYNSADGANPTNLAAYFSKNTTVKISHSGSAIGSIHVPAPILITAPVVNPTDPAAREVTNTTTIQWAGDADNKKGVVVSVREITQPTATDWPVGTETLLLTPDDGILSVGDLTAYIPTHGNFELTLTRLNYKILSSGGRTYRVVTKTASSAFFKYIP